ncbi:hypothetical protein [Sulfolobus sp. S-194]|nr:hypothetical protein [Sulfolobus sp. S-194]
MAKIVAKLTESSSNKKILKRLFRELSTSIDRNDKKNIGLSLAKLYYYHF